jgi:hypothetical protein
MSASTARARAAVAIARVVDESRLRARECIAPIAHAVAPIARAVALRTASSLCTPSAVAHRRRCAPAASV